MKVQIKVLLVALILVLLATTGFGVYNYYKELNVITTANICQDDDLIAKLIVNNKNPFSKFKFLKKRNADCKALLITNKEEAVAKQDTEACSVLDYSTNSITMLVYTYINDLYDRETASKELKSMVELMIPYDYCKQYYPDMLTLVEIKKRLGL